MKDLHLHLSCGMIAAFLLAFVLVGPAAAQDKPVKVYILSGQSNMVGIGTVNTSGTRWGKEMIGPVLSVYPGEYDPDVDYDKIGTFKTHTLERFGGVKPTPFPGGGVQIVRGQVKMPETGAYEFRPGYGDSQHNIMVVNGQEVYRKEPGQKNAEHTPIKLEADKAVDFKITYLTKGANGLGWTARIDFPGTLTTVVKQQGKYPELLDKDGNWASRDDVRYKGVVTAKGNQWLSVGCGADKGKVGPELGFGWVLGDYHDEPVLVLKASEGNRSLGWDFLPPGSERFEAEAETRGGEVKTHYFAGYKDRHLSWVKGTTPKEPEHNWYAGKQYDDCFNAAKDVLANFDKNFPMWKGRGYEIAGFVWWQGHKDSFNPVHRVNYQKNLVQLINTLRSEFKAPGAPFVVGTVGFGGFEGMSDAFKEIANAQLAVDADRSPFESNVKAVETRSFWKSADQSPKNQDFHYHQNGEVYYNIGAAFGKGMVELLEGE
ncbi:MAG: sialate O-acetylesterase [Phycisphaeraceae bacterium]|nr:sialate O-acetylesterase [Phycisphaeraceae bacterium]